MTNFVDLNALQSMIKVTKVEIKELNGHIFLKEMSGATINLLQGLKEDKYISNMLLNCVVKEDGSRMFNTGSEVDAFLNKVPMKVITAISNEITKINGLDNKDAEVEAKN